jgi:hypothetical protein
VQCNGYRDRAGTVELHIRGCARDPTSRASWSRDGWRWDKIPTQEVGGGRPGSLAVSVVTLPRVVQSQTMFSPSDPLDSSWGPVRDEGRVRRLARGGLLDTGLRFAIPQGREGQLRSGTNRRCAALRSISIG